MSKTTIHTGDALAVLKTLPSESVQCIVTSPPYYGLRDYGHDGQIGLEETPAAYVERLVAVFREARRVLRDDGVMWLNIADSYATKPYEPWGVKPKDELGIPDEVVGALRRDGWWRRSTAIWAKPNPMPESVTDRPTKSHEYVFLLTKSERYFYDAEAVAEESAGDWTKKGGSILNNTGWTDGAGRNDQTRQPGTNCDGTSRNRRTVWTIATQPLSLAHFAVMPPALAEVCVKAGTSERGRCPECGAPWERVVERETDKPNKYSNKYQRDTHFGESTLHPRLPRGAYQSSPNTTIGWQPTCDHEADPVPCVVLDPFGGAGTTGLVANRLDRDAILIELGPHNVELARKRIIGDAPMFANVEVA